MYKGNPYALFPVALLIGLGSLACGGGGGAPTADPTPAQQAPAVLIQPQDVALYDQEPGTLTVCVSGNPTPAVSWQQSQDGVAWAGVDGGELVRNVNGAVTWSLTVVGKVQADALKIRAKAENAVGTVFSDSITITFRPGWTRGPVFPFPRMSHTATPLMDGRVLLVGGWVDGMDSMKNFAPTQIYDPATLAWLNAPAPMEARGDHGAVLLASGKVLIIGGLSVATGSPELKTCELFNPVTGTWSPAAELPTTECYAKAVLLPDGRVFLISESSGVAYLYDPATDTWAATPPLKNPNRYFSAVTLLKDGRVLVVGGDGGAAPSDLAEIYDPVANTWAGAGNLGYLTTKSQATLLQDGHVVVTGGIGALDGYASNKVSLFDPGTATWTTGPGLIAARCDHQAVLLGDGSLVVVGGTADDDFTALDSLERYDPRAQTWTGLPPLMIPRKRHSVSTLADGTLFVAGGDAVNGPAGIQDWVSTFSETFDPNAGCFLPPARREAPPRVYSAAVQLPDGRVLVTGGDPYGSWDYSIHGRDAYFFDPVGGDWSPAPSLLVPRGRHFALTLPDGRAMVLGGLAASAGGDVNEVEFLDPAASAWTTGPTLPFPVNQSGGCVLSMDDGRVLILGNQSQTLFDPAKNTFTTPTHLDCMSAGARIGTNQAVVIGQQNKTAWLFDGTTQAWTSLPTMNYDYAAAKAVCLTGGRVLVAGSTQQQNPICEMFDLSQSAWTPIALDALKVGKPEDYQYLPYPSGHVLAVASDGAEVPDPGAGTIFLQGSTWFWGPELNLPRNSGFSLLLLSDGRAMVHGGLWSGFYDHSVLGHCEFLTWPDGGLPGN